MDPYRLLLDAAEAGLGDGAGAGLVLRPRRQAAERAPRRARFPAGTGVLLEEHLLAALRVDDQATLRRIIPEYVAWLGTGGNGSPDNVILDGTSYRLFGAAQDWRRRRAPGAVRAAGRWKVAHGNHGRPPPTRTTLTARLASMAGITVPAQEFSPDEVVRPLGSAEQLATVARLADELAHASARAILFEGTVSGIRRSLPYRVGHAVLNPARVIRRRLRRLVRKVRR